MLIKVLKKSDIKSLPPRDEDGNKGTFGRVLIIAGSKNMCGASYLAGLSAYRAGAGLVHLLAPECNRVILQCLLPEAVLTTYEDKKSFDTGFYQAVKKADSIVFGPGLGVWKDTDYILKTVLSSNKNKVIDADALNMLALRPEYMNLCSENCIFTPHLAEFSRLTGKSIDYIKNNKAELACKFSVSHKIILVLKDHQTVVAIPDGRCYINNKYGSSAMATGGSGDVLSGIAGAYLALKGVSAGDAAKASVIAHAMAGDRAASALSKNAVMARDIANNIR